MSEHELITSLTNPRVKRVVKLRKPRERRAAGVLIAEGRREVERAFAAGLVCRELFICEGLMGEVPDAAQTQRRRGEAVLVSADVLRKMAYHDKPEGVLAVFEAPAWSLDDVAVGADGLVLVVVGSEKPGNLGAMVRTAAAAGCAGVLAVGPAVDVFNPNAIRNSTGAVFSVPTVVVDDAQAAVAWLRGRGVTILAAVSPDAGDAAQSVAPGGAVSCFEAAWRFPAAVVVGPEHAGLDEHWRSTADVAVTIPMAGGSGGGVDSLNASAAAAVLLYEAVRRRGGVNVSP